MQAQRSTRTAAASLAEEAEEAVKAILSRKLELIELKRRAQRALGAPGLGQEARRFLDTYLPELVRYVLRQEYVRAYSSDEHRRRYLEEDTPILLARARNALAVVSVEASRVAVAEGIPSDAADALLALSRLSHTLAERLRPVTRDTLWHTWEELRELPSRTGLAPLVERAMVVADLASHLARDGHGQARRALDRLIDSVEAAARLLNDPDLLVEKHAGELYPDTIRGVRGYAGSLAAWYDSVLDNAAAILAGDWAGVSELADGLASMSGNAHALASVLLEKGRSGRSVYEVLGLGEKEVRAIIGVADAAGVLARLLHPVNAMLRILEHEARSSLGRKEYEKVMGPVRRYVMLRVLDATLP